MEAYKKLLSLSKLKFYCDACQSDEYFLPCRYVEHQNEVHNCGYKCALELNLQQQKLEEVPPSYAEEIDNLMDSIKFSRDQFKEFYENCLVSYDNIRKHPEYAEGQQAVVDARYKARLDALGVTCNRLDALMTEIPSLFKQMDEDVTAFYDVQYDM